ncbi:hypothetical protein Poli38472_008836 [Pythium oligandrum]|uniref:LicD/FKTN/FKRP nucleotidyltransferase domain-containing protein n=1 Tax=Pythium oligandrum TaxID=41045 RepID=A0A8K1FEU7_PYTOL|nr:hypothetical protein Poli38472_008836 [Pythium oligandrum]|eukprot:TMW56188.1 hypothetical protein Poli38472_008836 [Pythium oligandrum]
MSAALSSKALRASANSRRVLPFAAIVLVGLFGLVNVMFWVDNAINESSPCALQEVDYVRVLFPWLAGPDPKANEKKCAHLSPRHLEMAYVKPGSCLSCQELNDILRNLVLTTAATFEQHNITYFLDSGTLLGAFRDQRVIPFDNDADVGVDQLGLHYLQTKKIEFPPGYELTVWNSKLYPHSTRDFKLPGRVIHQGSGLYVDIFAYLEWKDEKTGERLVGPQTSWAMGNCVSCPKVATGRILRVPPEWLYPVVDCPFENATVKCPAQTEKLLKHVYGSSFRTPLRNH